jgi:hypothetical protein
MSKKEFELYLNAAGIPDNFKESSGGIIPDNEQYGTWLRKHDSVRFEVMYYEEENYGY